MRDFYRILGVDRGADDRTISKAYKALAKRLHPDVNPAANGGAGKGGATASDDLRDVIEAYQVLSKPVDRAAYDAAWGRGRGALQRRILLAAVLAMTGSVTIASLSAAYYWRAELLTERQRSVQQPTLQDRIAKTSPSIAWPTAPQPELAKRPPQEAPPIGVSENEEVRFPAPRAATSPTANELETITGPLRVARAVPALSATKAGEITRFADIEVIETDAADDLQALVAEPIAPVERPAGKKTVFPDKADNSEEPLPLPVRPPADAKETAQYVLTRQHVAALIENQYLSSRRRDRRTLIGLYCYKVDYWGDKATPRTSVVNQISDFVSRWPQRAYKLKPGSLDVVPAGRPHRYEAVFTYDFSVASGHGFGGAAGLASGRLIIQRQHGRWRICSEEGRVLKRYSPYSANGSKHASKYASRQPMDTHRILFGD